MKNFTLLLAILIPTSPLIVLVMLGFFRNLQRGGHALWRTIVWTLGVAPIIKTVLSPRIFVYDQSYLDLVNSFSGSEPWVLFDRVVNYWVIFLVVTVVMSVLVLKLRTPRGSGRPSLGLLLTMLFFSAGPLVSAFLGTQPSYEVGLLYLPLLTLTVFLLPAPPYDWLHEEIQRVLLVYVYGSLLSAVITPSWGLELGYSSGFIPGLNFRLHGVAPHANTLGPLALCYFIMDWRDARGGWKWIHRLVAGVVFLLAQSKTAWLAGVVIWLVMYLADRAAHRSTIQRSIVSIAGLLAASTAALLMLPNLSSDQGESLLTATGRTTVWGITLDLWKHNPWFGYGPSIWNVDQRVSYGLEFLWVGHAHNQLIQSLGEVGLIGTVGLVAYVGGLLVTSFLNAREGRIACFGLFFLVVFRGVTEVPLRNYAIDADFFMHWMLFALLMVGCRQAGSANTGAVCGEVAPCELRFSPAGQIPM